MPDKRLKHRRKRSKFKGLSFKLSADEYARLKRYCAKHKLTPNKLIKKSLTVYMQHYGPLTDVDQTPVSINQLSLFDVSESDPLPDTEILK